MGDGLQALLQTIFCALPLLRRVELHPEITAGATAAQAAEVTTHDHDAYASCDRTCEMGMTRATGKPCRHILELLEEATR